MSASRYPVSLVTWGDQLIPYGIAENRANEAEAFSAGFNLTTQVERWIDGEPWLVTEVDFFELARLLDKAREVQP